MNRTPVKLSNHARGFCCVREKEASRSGVRSASDRSPLLNAVERRQRGIVAAKDLCAHLFADPSAHEVVKQRVLGVLHVWHKRVE